MGVWGIGRLEGLRGWGFGESEGLGQGVYLMGLEETIKMLTVVSNKHVRKGMKKGINKGMKKGIRRGMRSGMRSGICCLICAMMYTVVCIVCTLNGGRGDKGANVVSHVGNVIKIDNLEGGDEEVEEGEGEEEGEEDEEESNNRYKENSNLLAVNVRNLEKNTYFVDSNMKSKYDNFKQINDDVVGYMECSYLGIDNAVVYSPIDNSAYLRRNVYGEEDISGTLYIDYRCTPCMSPFYVIHGHNMSDGGQFARLPDLMSLGSLDDVPPIRFMDEDGARDYKVVSVFSINSKDFALYINSLSTVGDLRIMRDNYISKSVVRCSDVPDSTDMLLLNTCWYGESGQEHNLHCIVVCVRM